MTTARLLACSPCMNVTLGGVLVLFVIACAPGPSGPGGAGGGGTGGQGGAGGGGDGGQVAAGGGGGGAPVCSVGASEACYSGPSATADVGVCHGGMRTCDAMGQWGPCVGEVTPLPEACATPADEDCDGMTQPCPICPVAHWTLDEASGIRADDSGNDLYLEEIGNPVGSEPFAQLGNAAAFGPALGVLGIPPARFQGSPLDLTEPAFTLAAWVRLDAAATGVIMSRERPCHGQVFGLLVDSVLKAEVGAGALPPTLTPSPVLTVGLWHHVATTYDGQLVRIFVNGVVVGEGVLALGTLEAPQVGPEFGFTVGGQLDVNDECANGDYHWTGAIDDAAVFDVALTTPQIQALMSGAGCL